MRIGLGLEYDGAEFNGWQSQRGARTVQGTLETALSKVADHPIKVICGGRTDAGVHAVGQVVHFDTQALRRMRSWVLGANANLPRDIAVTWAQPVAEDFHARFSAISRRYRYVILNRWVRPAVLRTKVTWQHRLLDENRMRQAAAHLVGEHDFTTFRALACQAKNPVRTVHELNVTREHDYVYIDIHANAFLYHMVRNIAGVLMTIGAGGRPVSWAAELLRLRDRVRGGVTAFPDGLYLVHIAYAQRFALSNEFIPPRYC
jgi:tRNA pseudouridine38-40 synthase